MASGENVIASRTFILPNGRTPAVNLTSSVEPANADTSQPNAPEPRGMTGRLWPATETLKAFVLDNWATNRSEFADAGIAPV